MEAILGGLGLAGAAGLNAYIPLPLLALAGRFGYAELGTPYDALSSDLGLGILAALLAAEVLADKVPGVNHANDLITTLVRPATGGVLVLASAGAGQLDPAPAPLLGALSAGGVHGLKATARLPVAAVTGGLASPIVSLLEDVAAVLVVVVALLFLLLLLGFALVIRCLRARPRNARSALADDRGEGWPTGRGGHKARPARPRCPPPSRTSPALARKLT